MAMEAGVCKGIIGERPGAIDGSDQVHVDGVVQEISVRIGHEILRVLIRLDGVADRAIPWTHNGVDSEAVVLETIFTSLGVHGVALCAAHGRVREFIRDLNK